MVRRRPVSAQIAGPTPGTLDVASAIFPARSGLLPLTILLSMIFFLAVPSSPSHARSLALISPPSQSHSRARQVRRLHAQLRRQLQAQGVDVVGERVFKAAARDLGLNDRTALHKARLPEICDELRIDGVLILGQSKGRGRLVRLSAYLFDARGQLRLKRQRLQRRSKAPQTWLRKLALSVNRRLKSAQPPLEDVPEELPESVPLVSMEMRAQASSPKTQAKFSGMEWQPAIEVGVENLGTSNLFFDASRQMDLALHPWLDLGVDLTGNWALGYRAEVRTWLQNEQLLQHTHRLYGAKGLAWGERDQNSLVLLASLDGNFNKQAYENLDFVQAQVQAILQVEVWDWLLAETSCSLGGRWFMHDPGSNSADSRLQARLSFRLPAGWALDIEARAAARLYSLTNDQTDEAHDLQGEGALHLSGSLWSDAKVSADLGYRRAIGDSHQVQRILAESQVRALGDAFLSSGHRADLRVEQMLGERSQVRLGLRFEQNDYAGWPALDAQGQDMGKERKDRRLGPSIAFGHGWWSQQDASSGRQLEYSLRLEYGFVRQWSNGPWTDVAVHMLGVQFQGAW